MVIPMIPATADEAIASGTSGLTSKFAGRATREKSPMLYKRSGKTDSCAANVVANVFAKKGHRRLKRASMSGESQMMPAVAATERPKPGSKTR